MLEQYKKVSFLSVVLIMIICTVLNEIKVVCIDPILDQKSHLFLFKYNHRIPEIEKLRIKKNLVFE
ncbi:hypothetical protein Mapa_014265 [Marchantia paleacea]|nr:hypothetical protein Mapa_014265 [Marchantia paleacea]